MKIASSGPDPSDPIARLDIDVFSDAALADPYAIHDALREAGPVFWLERYGCYGMARHEQVSVALRDFNLYCSGRGVGLADFVLEAPWRPPSLLLETDPPAHDRVRAIMNRVVSASALRDLRPAWLARARALVDKMAACGQIDAVTEISEVYPLMVFPDAVGIPVAGRDHLLTYAAAVFNAFGPRNALLEKANRAAAAAIDWVATACRRENLSPDGWGMAVYRAADAGHCSEAEAERLVRSFLSAGIDTTVNGLGNMLHAFTLFPDQWRRLREDRSLIKRTFEEALRWDLTVQTFFRTTTRPAEVDGVSLPEGAKVLLFLSAANRDPRRWEDPERFDIARQCSGHVAFGYGIHQCLGQMVARMEAELLLEAMLDRVVAIEADGPPQRRLNNTLHALASLPVRLVTA